MREERRAFTHKAPVKNKKKGFYPAVQELVICCSVGKYKNISLGMRQIQEDFRMRLEDRKQLDKQDEQMETLGEENKKKM